MRAKDTVRCTNCRRLQARVDVLEAELAALKQVVAPLSQQLASARQNSSPSPKPPTSDIAKPPKPPPPEGQDRRSIGGQPGHPKHERVAFPPESINGGSFDYRLDSCPACGQDLQPMRTIAPRVVQQVDIAEVPLSIAEHRSHPGWCTRCQKTYEAPLPSEIQRGGLVGPRLTTLIAYLKGFCHASFSTVRKFLRDVARVTISRGQLRKVIGKVCTALGDPYQELLETLPGEPVLNVDETGHRDNGKRMWTWCFRASLYTLFRVDPHRSGDVLIEVLGEEFDGVLGCDCFSAYRRYMREFDVTLQFCLAHLIRDVKFLMTLPGKKEQAYGTRLRDALRLLFGVIHQRDKIPAVEFQRRLEEARDLVLRVGQQEVPAGRHAQAMAKRLQAHGQSHFTFVTTPGVQPTNNLAEQAIRFVVIDRHITQGTRSQGGQRWCERIWSVIASCTQQGRSVFDYLYAAVKP